MKTLKFSLLIVALIFLTCGCLNKKDNYLNEIDYSTFEKMVKEEKTFFVEIIQTGCSACAGFTPKFEEVLTEHKITAYQLNLSDMDKKDREKFDSEYNVSGTPTVIFITKGSEESKLQRITSNIAKSKIVAKLEANGYIKVKDEESNE